jgi:Zn-dependent membrane protease YugP
LYLVQYVQYLLNLTVPVELDASSTVTVPVESDASSTVTSSIRYNLLHLVSLAQLDTVPVELDASSTVTRVRYS